MGDTALVGERFSPDAFRRVVRLAARRSDESDLPGQVEYLIRYLQHSEVSAQWMLVETSYIDRHYLEEFTGYYANAFRPPQPTTTRVHFFKTEVDLPARITQASNGAYDEACKELGDGYLGFTVVRPIASCPVGRTIVAPYPPGGKSRHYAKLESRVHLAGLNLIVEGVPFQQQDQAVGACATTAVWSALSHVSRSDGGRAPTPFAITKAATRQLVRNRTFPAADGLSVEQIAGAIRDWGYSPHCMASHGAMPEFQLAVKCYLRSGIPVILVTAGDPGHAFTAVGFREGDEDGDPLDLLIGDATASHIRATGMSRLYVHDDRLGPYVRMLWLQPEAERGYPRLRKKTFPGEQELEPEAIRLAIAPLYPKLRLSAKDLSACANEFVPAVRNEVGADKEKLRVELRFSMEGKYLEALLRGKTLSPERAATFVQGVRLPRYVGVATFTVDGQLVADALFDTTDINRNHPRYASLIAVVPYAEAMRENFLELVKQNAPERVVVA